MQVALAGCRKLGNWGIGGAGGRPWDRADKPPVEGLRARGATVSTPAWDDPGVDWASFDTVLIRATWDYHHHRDAFVAWAERVGAATRLLNPAPIIAWNTVKTYLRDLPVPQPETVWIERAEEVRPALAERGWGTAFLKPIVGATAEGTLRFDDASVAEDHVRRLGGHFLLQPYLATVGDVGERSAIVIGGEVTHAVRKLPVPGDYRVQDDYGATDEPATLTEAELELVAATMRALPEPVAYARVDWLTDDEGQPRLIELELVEPCLFFRHGPGAAERLADIVRG
ncbi:MAG: hypothetical protein KC656_15100 [Myxococcales bacterium]|nr:hypothetical protein [Myxococcales bacterium]